MMALPFSGFAIILELRLSHLIVKVSAEINRLHFYPFIVPTSFIIPTVNQELLADRPTD